jgi:hypothetical protein
MTGKTSAFPPRRGRPPGRRFDVKVWVCLTVDQEQALQQACGSIQRPGARSDVIRLALSEWLHSNGFLARASQTSNPNGIAEGRQRP